MKIKFKDFTGAIESFFRNDATVARTYQFQDRNGTISDDTDLSRIWKKCGNVAMSSNSLLTLTGATGSGTSGAIKENDMFYNTASSTTLKGPDGLSLIPNGCWIIALQDTPTLITHFSFIPSML
jgi:hypothetical protein